MQCLMPDSHQMEHDFASIIYQQAIDGWEFNLPRAVELYHELNNRMEEIYDLVRPHLVQEMVVKYAPVANPFKKDGEPAKRVTDYWGNEVVQVYGPYSPVHWEEPDIGSRNKLMKQLQRHGWKPVNFTEKGNPQLDEESLDKIDLGETGNLLIEYFKAKQRRSTLLNDRGGWLTKAYEYEPQKYRISAEANPCATNTHRCAHRIVANVPKASPEVYYGKDFRSLFIVRPGHVLVGADASQLEFRCALSYMNAHKMIELVADPETDVHTVMFEEMKPYMESRSSTKNIVYGSVYGASDLKLGQMADHVPPGLSKKEVGRRLKAVLVKYMPGLAKFDSHIRERGKRGFLVGIDGFPIYLRKNERGPLLHTAVNSLLQHCGSMVVKRATVYLHERAKVPFKQVGHFHDEVQLEALPEHAQELGELFNECLIAAGDYYQLACPMEGEYQVGESWAETH